MAFKALKLTSRNRSTLGVRAVSALGLLVAAGCAEPPSEELGVDSLVQERPSLPAQVVEGGYFEYSEHGNVVQALEASRLERWERSETNALADAPWQVDEGFVLYIGGTKQTHTARLSATRGTYDDQFGRLEAWENVELVNESGDRMQTEHLIWSHDSDLVRTNRPVEIHTAQGVLRGRGLRADSRFERYEILSPTGSFDLGLDSDSVNAPQESPSLHDATSS
jgi:LPS export ABC transporter protein LptC